MVTVLVYYFSPTLFGEVSLGLMQVLCWLVALVTALSGGIYLWQNRSCFAQAK